MVKRTEQHRIIFGSSFKDDGQTAAGNYIACDDKDSLAAVTEEGNQRASRGNAGPSAIKTTATIFERLNHGLVFHQLDPQLLVQRCTKCMEFTIIIHIQGTGKIDHFLAVDPEFVYFCLSGGIHEKSSIRSQGQFLEMILYMQNILYHYK